MSRLASRLLAGAAIGVLAVGLGGPAPAGAATEPTPTGDAGGSSGANPQLVGPQTAGTPGCALPAELDEVTGIAVTPSGIALIEGTDKDQVEIHTLDAQCTASREPWSGTNPRSPQDLLYVDGAFYVCDCGDPDLNRETIAMEKVVPGAGGWEIYRFSFPSGQKLSAKAMLLGPGGVPIFFATESTGVTGVYTVTALPAPNNQPGAALTKVYDWTAEQTGTPTSVPGGESTVTGAAVSPDGSRVVIRTYSDAYEYEVTGGDIVTAIQGDPIGVTPLIGESQGEAITYTADGNQFLTASSGGGTLLTFDRWEAPPVVVTTTTTSDEGSSSGGFLSRFSMSQLTQIIGAVGVVGIVLAIAGIIGIRRARRRRLEEDDWDDEDDDYEDDDDYDDEYDDRRSRRRRGRDRDRDRYGPREPAYAAGGYDDSTGGGYGQDYPGYDQGYGAQGYDQGYGDPGYGGYQQGYGAQGYDQGYGDPGYDPGYAAQPGYGGYDQGQYDQGQYDQGQYDQGQYGGGQYGGGYGGYGDEFDPMDPRRR
jgi:hypothetical protein